MGNPVTWFELGAADPEPLKVFYASLFGWKIDSQGEGYSIVATGGGINGGIGRSGTGDPWLSFYVEVPDLEATLQKAVAAGGSVVVPMIEIPGVSTFAMFNDPDGLLIGILKGSGGEEGFVPPFGEGPAVDWFEILGSDAERSQALYRDLFGWSFTSGAGGYGLVDTGAGRGISGGVGTSGDGRTWATVYASVDDVERYLARAEELGGTREYGPLDVDDHMQSGALRDPAGNLFGVYHHAPH
jgi:predicted enzyme related to lactoylglutathione lyase